MIENVILFKFLIAYTSQNHCKKLASAYYALLYYERKEIENLFSSVYIIPQQCKCTSVRLLFNALNCRVTKYWPKVRKISFK